ncbi:MAG: efflux RND transporter periplasmic adaptor subunit [Bacteroidales bacterium]|nr:efflux RND transporter periplasmic adaptor subunit [Bacteroidales bacterium]
MNRKLIYAAAAILALSACSSKTGKNNDIQQTAEAKTPVVSVITASKQTVPQTGSYSASIQAYAVNNIASQTGGRIQKLNREIGDFVSAGDVLAELDRIQLDQAELTYRNNERELQRLSGLLKEGGVSQSDFDSFELSYKVSKSNYENLLENTILRSPINGVISARNYDRGDMYSMSSPIYTVQQIVPVKLLVLVSESDYTRIKKGDSVDITVDALPGKTFKGSVLRLYPTIDAASHTFSAELVVRNENRELRPGMYARATVLFEEVDRIVVPDGAVVKQQGSGQKLVYVLDADNCAHARVVETGRHIGNEYEIISGIEEGETIVVKGNSNLKSGEKVEVVK